MKIDKLLPVENDAEAGNIFQSNESRPRLIVMASEEISSDLPVDAVVPKHAPPALLLDVLTLNRNPERKNV